MQPTRSTPLTTPTDSSTPAVPTRLLRLPEVEARTGQSRSTIYDAMKRGYFPRPVKIVRISEQSYHPFRSKVTTEFGAKLPAVSV